MTEVMIGFVAIVLIVAVYKFMSKTKATPFKENAYKFPEDPLVEKDPNQGPDSENI